MKTRVVLRTFVFIATSLLSAVATGQTAGTSSENASSAADSEDQMLKQQINNATINSFEELMAFYEKFLNRGQNPVVIEHGRAAMNRLKAGLKGAPPCMLHGIEVSRSGVAFRAQFNMVERCNSSTGRVVWWYEDKRDVFKSIAFKNDDVVEAELSNGITVRLAAQNGRIVSEAPGRAPDSAR
jgi:hypothetical protein